MKKRLIPYLFIIFAGLGWASGQQQQRGQLGRQMGQMADIAAANQSSVASMKLHHIYSFMSGEQLPFPPPPFAAYVNAGAGWVALTGTGSVGAIPNSPPPAAMYVLSGSSWIPWTGTSSGGGTTTNPLTMNNSGSGAASGTTFDGSVARTISYNTVGAAPAIVPLTSLATQAADTMVGNATGGSASPTAVAMPAGCTTGVNYSTASHVWTCPSPAMVNITGSVTVAGCAVTNGACVVTGSAAASITFSVIPATYNHLVIMMVAATNVSASQDVYLQYNGDSAANYTRQFNYASGGSAPIIGQTASSAQAGFANVPGTNAVAGSGGIATITIPFYSRTTFNKIATAFNGGLSGAAVTSLSVSSESMTWANTAAITSVLMSPITSGGSFIVGSSFTIYGVL